MAPVQDHSIHNGVLSNREVRAARRGVSALVAYLSADAAQLTTWIGEPLATVVWSRVGRRYRWDPMVRGHAHAGRYCYTFSSPGPGMYAKLRRVGSCGSAPEGDGRRGAVA